MATIRENILKTLKSEQRPLAEHEFPFCGTNSSCLTRELRRMQAENIVKGERRLDEKTGELKKFKEWSLKEENNTMKNKLIFEDPKSIALKLDCEYKAEVFIRLKYSQCHRCQVHLTQENIIEIVKKTDSNETTKDTFIIWYCKNCGNKTVTTMQGRLARNYKKGEN